jgi:hypothetical protein
LRVVVSFGCVLGLVLAWLGCSRHFRLISMFCRWWMGLAWVYFGLWLAEFCILVPRGGSSFIFIFILSLGEVLVLHLRGVIPWLGARLGWGPLHMGFAWGGSPWEHGGSSCATSSISSISFTLAFEQRLARASSMPPVRQLHSWAASRWDGVPSSSEFLACTVIIKSQKVSLPWVIFSSSRRVVSTQSFFR